MIYASTITIPANTAEADKTTTILKITSGLVWLFEVDFPAGCCGLAHVQIYDGLYQVLPTSVGESLHGEGVTLRFDDLYFKTSAPFDMLLKTWNLDDTWSHTVQVRLGLATSEAEMSRYMPAMAWDNFQVMMLDSIKLQEAIRQEQLESALKQLTGE